MPNDWGGPLACRVDGTYGPWVMTNPERLIGMAGIGNKECVAIAQATMTMPLTSLWRGGEIVLGGKLSGNSVNQEAPKGTVIATFIDGRYPSNAHGNHVAIYISQGRDYIYVIDQWSGQVPHYRHIYVKEGMTDRSNNANAFSVVYTLPAAPAVPRRQRTRRR